MFVLCTGDEGVVVGVAELFAEEEAETFRGIDDMLPRVAVVDFLGMVASIETFLLGCAFVEAEGLSHLSGIPWGDLLVGCCLESPGDGEEVALPVALTVFFWVGAAVVAAFSFLGATVAGADLLTSKSCPDRSPLVRPLIGPEGVLL